CVYVRTLANVPCERTSTLTRMRRSVASLVLSCGLVMAACNPQQPPPEAASQETRVKSEASVGQVTPDYGPFRLKPEPEVSCARAEKVDVNLGHTPESFVRAAHCQIHGTPPTDEVVNSWADKLKNHKFTRRVDVVRALCKEANRSCELTYSDPWESQVELAGAPERKVKREVGAVCMFFFNCPDGVNCKMNWANTHAVGMDEPHPLLGFGKQEKGYYVPDHPGFWRREL